MGTNESAERRDTPRRPFRGTVELTLSDDTESYEAEAVNLSIGGMAVRTAFLPDVGSELDCKFTLESGTTVAARGEVVWAQDSGQDAGVFGLRFTEMTAGDERHIRDSFGTPRDARDTARRGDDETRARLYIPGMEAPLRARVRTCMDDVVVLGANLSFLKLGEGVEVERGTERSRGHLEDISVEIDPVTNVTRLVLTVALERATATARESQRVTNEPASMEPIPLSAPKRPAYATEVLTSDCDGPAAAVTSEQAQEATGSDAASVSRREPPAWLVSTLQALRAGGRAVRIRLASILRATVSAVTTFALFCLKAVRGRVGQSPDAAPSPRGGLRKQQVPSGPNSTTSPEKISVRKKYGLYALAGLGVVAIVFALVTGKREPAPTVPRPQVAVTASPAQEVPSAQPATSENVHGDSTVAQNNGVGGANNTMEEETEPARPATTAPTTALNEQTMPSDLVAAARSPNANVEANAPVIRTTLPSSHPARVSARDSTAPAQVVRSSRGSAVAARSLAASESTVIGHPAVRTGTVLRLRMDGPVSRLSGGVGPDNVLVIRLPGRRSLDLAAPLVRQDARLQGAGVYNRAAGAELVLRFRDSVPMYAARANGNTLEIVLASTGSSVLRGAVPQSVRSMAPRAVAAASPRRR